jgi:hypothetical protein
VEIELLSWMPRERNEKRQMTKGKEGRGGVGGGRRRETEAMEEQQGRALAGTEFKVGGGSKRSLNLRGRAATHSGSPMSPMCLVYATAIYGHSPHSFISLPLREGPVNLENCCQTHCRVAD